MMVVREIANRTLELIVSSLAPHKLTAPVIDNYHGWGATPNMAEIGYLGAVLHMKPATFLSLAEPWPNKKTEAMEQHLLAGGGIAAPYLRFSVPNAWYEGDFSTGIAEVVGHEGRHRMESCKAVFGNKAIETHILIESPSHTFRNRHITPKLIQAINKQALQQETGKLVHGPLFSPHS